LVQAQSHPLAQRVSLTKVEDILIDPDSSPRECSPDVARMARDAAERIAGARRRGAGVILMYGAHLLRNGAALILERMMSRGWVTHLATNGAGSIHDWEYSWLGRSTESVEKNVATGTFGAWDETGRNITWRSLPALYAAKVTVRRSDASFWKTAWIYHCGGIGIRT
jgi:hypothetical protein